ncbi:hypothetical protein HHI36_008239 [Cryptolaemus montrouzieri]|uniref:Uncharacterized protein n=1 Tax=Cryptolaemus montrouzieri TaxID=559131 RepID=A0ABD2MSF1_9CUCU
MSNSVNRKFGSDILIVSLNQDLKCLDGIIENILPRIGNMEIQSWLYPHKNYNRNGSYDPNEAKEVSYIHCLELIIDKLYIILNIVNENMYSIKNRRNIYYPSRVTLGRCVKQFLELVNQVEEKSCNKIPRSTTPIDVINKESQTENKTLDKCDSCTQANYFLKDIVEYISTNFDKSLTKINKHEVNDNIYDVTKFGATMKLTNSIKQDYHNIAGELHENLQKNYNLLQNVSKLESDISQAEFKIKDLTACNLKYLEQLSNSEKELQLTKEYIKTVEKEKSELLQSYNDYGSIIKELTDRMKISHEKRAESQKYFEEQIENYENVIEQHKSKIIYGQNSFAILKEDFDKLKINYEELYGKYSRMSQMNYKLEKTYKK